MPACTASVAARGPPNGPPTASRRRSRDTGPSNAQREAAAAEAPWTAARCLRHLRPILSHLAALRREKARAARHTAGVDNSPTYDSGVASSAAKRPCPAETDCLARKRVRYTYSLKGTKRRNHQLRTATATAAPGTQHNKADDPDRPAERPADRPRLARLERRAERYVAPGEVLVATPVLNRARKHQQQPGSPVSPSTLRPPRGCQDSAATSADSQLRAKRPSSSAPYRGYYDGHVRAGVLRRCGLKPGSSSSGNNRASSSMDDAWLQFHTTTPPALRQLYESVFRAVDALLKATASKPGAGTGMARSLLAMCLRKVPQYMTVCEEEAASDTEEPNVTQQSLPDASFDIYSDLESLGSGSGAGGWKHLRTVVRAHGIDVIKAACAEGLLHAAFVRLLVRRCVELQAYSEAETLLDVLVDSNIGRGSDRDRCAEPSSVDSTFVQAAGGPACLQDLVQYAEDTGRTRLLLATLDRLLQCGRLPVAWLSTRAFDSIWGRILDTLSKGRALAHHEDALVAFLTTAMTRLVLAQPADDLPDGGSSPCRGQSGEGDSSSPCKAVTGTVSSSSSFHTLVSILSSITAVSLLQAEATSDAGQLSGPLGNETANGTVDPASRCTTAVLLECLVNTAKPQQQTRRRGRRSKAVGDTDDFRDNTVAGTRRAAVRRFLLALAHFVVHRDDKAGQAMCVKVAGDIGEAGRALLYDSAVAFAASVAESCGRGTASAEVSPTLSSSRLYLTRLCARMVEHLGRPCFATGPEDMLLRRMKADGAFQLASRTNDLRDLAFAERLAGSSDLSGTTPRKGTTAPTALFVGYRWEEGISEWVISTPASVPRPAERVPQQGSKKSEPAALGRHEPVGLRSRKAVGSRLSPSERLSAAHIHTRASGQPGIKAALQRRKQHRPTATTLLGLVSDDDDDDDDDTDDENKENNDDELNVWAVCTMRRPPLQRLDGNATPRPRPDKGQEKQDGLRKRASTGRVSISLGFVDCAGASRQDDTTSDDELCM